MSDLIERLRQHWLNQGFSLDNGASKSQLEELQSKYQIILPDDFKEYLLSISWSKDYDSDDQTISFRTINRINEEAFVYRYSDTENYLAFADFLISSHEYGIKLQSHSSTTPVFLLWNHTVIQIASSFTEFLERYLLDDENLLFPK
ncbi:MAG: SMI1/KNR4 family protein [Abditibacteriaceae bacterium]